MFLVRPRPRSDRPARSISFLASCYFACNTHIHTHTKESSINRSTLVGWMLHKCNGVCINTFPSPSHFEGLWLVISFWWMLHKCMYYYFCEPLAFSRFMTGHFILWIFREFFGKFHQMRFWPFMNQKRSNPLASRDLTQTLQNWFFLRITNRQVSPPLRTI